MSTDDFFKIFIYIYILLEVPEKKGKAYFNRVIVMHELKW